MTAPFLHIFAALLLGWLVGYERYYSGRSSGTQVYCIVCSTSCAITLLAGSNPDHVIGSILQGIGFLGAGIIVQTGINVRGLTTAASIWSSAAIGILVGAGRYPAALALTVLFMVSVRLVPRIEIALPARAAMSGTVRFREGFTPQPERIRHYLAERGLHVPLDSFTITNTHGRFELKCIVFANKEARGDAMGRIVHELAELAEVESFTVVPSSRA